MILFAFRSSTNASQSFQSRSACRTSGGFVEMVGRSGNIRVIARRLRHGINSPRVSLRSGSTCRSFGLENAAVGNGPRKTGWKQGRQ
jgi:hypothetical protein